MNMEKAVFQIINNLLSTDFEVTRNVQILGREIPLLAHSNLSIQQYLFSEKWVVDEVRTNDYLFCWLEDSRLTRQDLDHSIRWLQRYSDFVNSSDHQHMRSRYIGIIFSTSQTLDPNVQKYLKLCSRSRWLKWGFHGWNEYFLIVFHLPTSSWMLTRKSREFKLLLSKIKEQLLKYRYSRREEE